ncbi:MAG: hypothetical protein PHP41_03805 [Bacilli bacterium]|nr:hypothetical protein [Bacilli bacterium]
MKENKQIDIFYDLYDKACLFYHHKLQLDYLSCIIRVGTDLTRSLNDTGLELEDMEELEFLYDQFSLHRFTNEEVRIAMELIVIKGLKDNGSYVLDLMTPDAIGYLFAFLISKMASNHATVLDVCTKTGNLISTIHNFTTQEFTLYGIESDPLLVELTKVVCDLQNTQITIFQNSCMDPLPIQADFIIGDLGKINQQTEMVPQQIILHFLENLNDKGFFIYLIDNDFFNREGAGSFKTSLQGSLLGLIVLPDTMFQDNSVGKSILIGSKYQTPEGELCMINMPSLTDSERLNHMIQQVEEWTIKWKGMIQ